MAQLYKSPAAEADLESIWLYSFERWGEAQADLYFDQLVSGMDQLLANPMLGQSREEVRQGYRSLQVKHHVIYYRLVGDMIDIVRVLHEKMLPLNHV
jgi:toxin ParE1/3/4